MINGGLTRDSDIDLLADVAPNLGLIGLGRAAEDFERILQARVDLVPADGLKADVADRVAPDLVAL